MGFSQAVSDGLANYFNFRGRASRPAYWYFVLFLVIAGIVTAIVDLALFGSESVGPINSLFGLATFIPSLSVGVRRLHDIGRTGWWLLLSLIPIIGWIVLIYWNCQPTDPHSNAYGSPP